VHYILRLLTRAPDDEPDEQREREARRSAAGPILTNSGGRPALYGGTSDNGVIYAFCHIHSAVCVTCDAVCRCRVACVPYRHDRPSVRPSAVADSTPATADDCHNSKAVITSSAAHNTAVRCRRPDYICAPTAHYTPVHTVFHTHVLRTKERRSTSSHSVDGMAKKMPEERETRVLWLYTRS